MPKPNLLPRSEHVQLPAPALDNMSDVAKAKIPPGLLPGPKVIHVEAGLSQDGEFFFDFDTGTSTQTLVPEADVAFSPPLGNQPFLSS